MNGIQLADVVILVPDKNTEYAIRGILNRQQSLGIKKIQADIFIHLERDPGCLNNAHEYLRPFIKKYKYALVLFDRHGCGREYIEVSALAAEAENRLSMAGWKDRCAVIVIDPELEAWVWSDSPQVARVLGWNDSIENLSIWLKSNNLWGKGYKPDDPKKAMEQVLQKVKKPRSSFMYEQLALHVSFDRCIDSAFSKLQRTLRDWFSVF